MLSVRDGTRLGKYRYNTSPGRAGGMKCFCRNGGNTARALCVLPQYVFYGTVGGGTVGGVPGAVGMFCSGYPLRKHRV